MNYSLVPLASIRDKIWKKAKHGKKDGRILGQAAQCHVMKPFGIALDFDFRETVTAEERAAFLGALYRH